MMTTVLFLTKYVCGGVRYVGGEVFVACCPCAI